MMQKPFDCEFQSVAYYDSQCRLPSRLPDKLLNGSNTSLDHLFVQSRLSLRKIREAKKHVSVARYMFNSSEDTCQYHCDFLLAAVDVLNRPLPSFCYLLCEIGILLNQIKDEQIDYINTFFCFNQIVIKLESLQVQAGSLTSLVVSYRPHSHYRTKSVQHQKKEIYYKLKNLQDICEDFILHTSWLLDETQFLFGFHFDV